MIRFDFLNRLLKDEKGTSAVEYGLICSLIILAMLGALKGFAGEALLTWNNISTSVSNAVNHSTAG